MTIRLETDGTIVLEGNCPVGDAEPLLRYVTEFADAPVDWQGCEWAHTAVIQVLLVAGMTPRGQPRGAFLKDFVAPILAGEPRRDGGFAVASSVP